MDAIQTTNKAANFGLHNSSAAAVHGKRVLLIYPPVRLSAIPLYPPFGLLSIAAVLEKAGLHTEILDLNYLRLPFEKLKIELKKRKFDVIGIGGMTTVYYYMKFLSIYLKKEYPEVPIIGGGSACSATPNVVLERTGIDVACIGEGEPIIVTLVAKLITGGDLSDIPGLWYKDRNGDIHQNEGRPRMANITDLPFPAYHLVDMEPYIENSIAFKHKKNPLMQARIKRYGIDIDRATRPVMLFTKRGCPFGCNFCYRNFGRKVVYSTIDYTLDHMSFLEKKYNTVNFVFGDEIFNVSKDWVMEFCQRIIDEERCYILSTMNGLRANVLDREMMEIMHAAGFCSVGVGIESFYDPTLKAMKKGQSADHIFKAIKTIREVGFHINSAQLLFGYETDSNESMEINIRTLEELDMAYAGFAIPCPYPGTYLYDIAREKGLIPDEEEWLMELADKDISDKVINMSRLPDSELIYLAQYGEDSVRMNYMRKKYPILGWILHRMQYYGRKRGVDTFKILKGLKDSIKTMRVPRGISRSGLIRDEYIREEVLQILDSYAMENQSQLDPQNKPLMENLV
jgi:radical SAM superfamily enzyme YgiQ (UPF0313 family)